MISLGFELPSPPPTKKDIREWRKWQKEMNMILGTAPRKWVTTLGKKKLKRKELRKMQHNLNHHRDCFSSLGQ